MGLGLCKGLRVKAKGFVPRPGGLRMGAPALTLRSFIEADIDRIADFVDRCASNLWEMGLFRLQVRVLGSGDCCLGLVGSL